MTPLNQRVRALIRREYMQRVRSRWFLFTTLVVPVLFLGAVFLPAFLAEGGQKSVLPVGIVDRTREGAGRAVAEALQEEEIPATIIEQLSGPGPGGPEDLASLRAALLEAGEGPDASLDPTSRWRAVLLLPRGTLEGAEAVLVSLVGGRTEIRSEVRDALETGVREARLEAAGITPEEASALLSEAPLTVAPLRVEEGSGGFREGVGFVTAMILYMLFLVYGQMIARGVMEEKTSDIVEILVSTVRPWELMLGKILGVGAVGLTQVGIWALVLVLTGLFGVSAAAPWLAGIGLDQSTFVVPWDMLAWSGVYFLLGYFLYSAVFASAGAMVTNEQDIQQVMLPAMIPIILPIVLMPAVMGAPDATWAVVCSLVPFFTPILMPVRLAIARVPSWQTLLAFVLLALSVPAMAWVAGRIYRVGILMKGKRPNLPELLRWLRYG